MDEKRKDLTDDFSDSLTAIKSIGSGLGETLLDLTMDEGLIKKIPMVSTVVALYDFSSSLHKHVEIRKLVKFIEKASIGIDCYNEGQKIYENMQKDKKKFNESLEYMIYILSVYSHEEKADILARFFVAFLRGVIKYDQLQMYADLINQLMPNELRYIRNELYGAQYLSDIRTAYTSAVANRMIALGLSYEEIRAQSSPLMAHGVNISIFRELKITKFGHTFFNIAFDSNYNKQNLLEGKNN